MDFRHGERAVRLRPRLPVLMAARRTPRLADGPDGPDKVRKRSPERRGPEPVIA